MDDKLFNRLLRSMKQMEEIERGKRAPSREFHVGTTLKNLWDSKDDKYKARVLEAAGVFIIAFILGCIIG